MLDPLIFLIGWILGASSLIMGVAAAYYLYKTSKLYGGAIGSNLSKICFGTIALIIGLIVLGILLTNLAQEIPDSIDTLLIATVFTVPGFLLMAIGARNLVKTAKG